MERIKSAWLIYWVWDGNESKAITDKIITIINYRRSGKFISDLIEVIYAINSSNLRETGHSAKKRIKSKDKDGYFICPSWGPPYIEARKVKNIEVFENREGKEVIRWIQPATYKLSETPDIHPFTEATPEIQKEFVRVKSGLLSFLPLSSLNKSET